ncbi:MAG: DUF2961 domain-containing protein [Planctomycetota bacterium]|jgi:hypothetical protein|nr:DUF2961 domain-containing protein [Planctomycetota bacterium]MDP6942109.1 DUF2961 domain-containing protein [Planctomycetota bacterium]
MLTALLLSALPIFPAQSLEYGDLLLEYKDLTQLAAMPVEGVHFRQFSSYDRQSEAGPGDSEAWFANQDRGNYLRKEELNGEPLFVMAEHMGPGVIRRIWSANPSGDILFFVNGSQEPALRVPMLSLFDGSHDAFQSPLATIQAKGHTSWVPLPFAKSLKVCTTESDLYYHIGVRTYPSDFKLPSLSDKLLSDNQSELDFVNNLLASREFVSHPRRRTEQVGRYRPNMQQSLWINGRGTVHFLRVVLMNQDKLADIDSILRNMRVEILADRSKVPQVNMPFSEFFGAGPGLQPHLGYLTRIKEEKDGSAEFHCFLPMPFENGIRLNIFNESRSKIYIKTQLYFDTEPPKPLRLHAGWHSELDVSTRPHQDWSVLDAEGPGRLVGTQLSIRNLTRTWWGEGDEKIYVDGETHPSIFGTGTEDFFGYAWCCPDTFTHPLFAQTRCDGPDNYGWTSLNRFMIGDSIPFMERIRFDLELWHWEDLKVDLATSVWWYAPLEGTHRLPPIPDPDARDPRMVPEAPPKKTQN